MAGRSGGTCSNSAVAAAPPPIQTDMNTQAAPRHPATNTLERQVDTQPLRWVGLQQRYLRPAFRICLLGARSTVRVKVELYNQRFLEQLDRLHI